MGSMTATANKLQMALCRRGDPISFEQRRYYSIKYNRPMTKYIICRHIPGKRKERLLETYHLKEAVVLLAKLYLEPQEAGADG